MAARGPLMKRRADMTEDAPEITADDILNHLTGGLDNEGLHLDDGPPAALLYTDFASGLVHAIDPDAEPTRTLGKFRVHVERVED